MMQIHKVLKEWKEIKEQYESEDYDLLDMGSLYYIACKLAEALEVKQK